MLDSLPPVAQAARPGRVYGGRSLAERDAHRRARILDAGLELFGTKGFGPTTMTEVAWQAEVPFRYVGRLFADKPALLEAVFLRIQDQVMQEVARARAQADPCLVTQIRTGLHAALAAYASDGRRVRISCLEVVGLGGRLSALRQDSSRAFVDQLVSGLDQAARAGEALPPGYALLGVGLVGAVEALLTGWALAPEPRRPPLADVTEAACLIYLRTLGLPDRADA
jgi:AcrR family transcriptional regulator